MNKDKIAGFLEIGLNENLEIVLNLDEDRVGHIVFSINQARMLARVLNKKANEADKILKKQVMIMMVKK